MVRTFAAAFVMSGVLGACAADSDSDGDGDGGSQTSRCDVYAGKDEFVACVCENAKPCVGLGTPEDCARGLLPALKSGQRVAGLDCTQAIGDLFACELDLRCPEFNELLAYWQTCWDTDPGGQRQPYCAAETEAVELVCGSGYTPCGGY